MVLLQIKMKDCIRTLESIKIIQNALMLPEKEKVRQAVLAGSHVKAKGPIKIGLLSGSSV